MANLHLVTGFAGQAHVTAADEGSLNSVLYGAGSYVLNRGSKFNATVLSNNSIRIADGDIMLQGRHVRLNEGSYVDLAIENGSQGNYRNDLIVVRYTKNSSTGVEECNLIVIKGVATTGTATDPDYIQGDIIEDHALTADFPLYRVPLNGLNVQELVPLFDVLNVSVSEFNTNALTAETNIADGDYFPFYDTSTKAQRKTLWSNILAKIKVGTSNINNNAVTKEKISTGATYTALTVTLTVAGWSNNQQTVNVTGVTANNSVVVSPTPISRNVYSENGVYCSEQATGTLTFKCESVPASDLTVNILIPR